MSPQTFYRLLAYLSLRQAGCTETSARFNLSRLLAPDGSLSLASRLKEFFDPYQDCIILEGLILEPRTHLLYSADRTVLVDQEFLEKCEPAWAEKLRAHLR